MAVVGVFVVFVVALAAVVDSCTMGHGPKIRIPRQQPSFAVYEQEIEDDFLSVPNNDTAREALWHYTRHPHVAGTEGDYDLAVWTRDQMRSFGLDSEVVPVNVSLTYPVSRKLQLEDESGHVLFSAALAEDVIPADITSDNEWRNTTFNAYAPSGLAVSELVYANYGRPEDFDVLQNNNISVAGKIVLVRYGECFRGLKVMNGEQRGAVGTIIYSDPADDGFVHGPTYPDGPWRPPTSVQRGSVQFNSLCAGDPFRAYLNNDGTEQVCGLPAESLVPRFPVLPISYGDALPLLKSLGGPLAPSGFVGGLEGVEYRLGPSVQGQRVRLDVVNEFVPSTPIWNVVTKIPGTLPEDEDRPILLGNHRDALVIGAADPNSGSTAMLEIARGFSQLLSKGWKPQRSIVMLSWSGEEYGLLGSTAWAELNSQELFGKVVAYLNVDVGVSGHTFSASGTPSLGAAVASVLQRVNDPTTGQPLSELWDHKFGTLGSGSDYTVMLDNLGIASVDMRFKNNDTTYGTYHSIYDSFHWMETQADPSFLYHKAMAQVWGLLALRLATAPVLPFDHVTQANAIQQYIDSVARLLPNNTAPVSLAPLISATTLYKTAAQNISRALSLTATRNSTQLAPSNINDRLSFTERRFLASNGLPGRKWFKHVLQAPGLYLGYGAVALPGVTQAVTDGNWAVASQQIAVAAKCIGDAANYLAGVGEM